MQITSHLRKFITATALSAAALGASAADNMPAMPQIHGVLRTRLEMTTTDPVEYRFQVRYARLSLGGDIGPSVKYFVQTDLCDQGKIKILDVWSRIALAPGLYIQAGQFRMPFGVETFMAPSNYVFSNRSFIGKQMCNYRAVGAKLAYTLPSAPLLLEAGVFNPRAIGDHNVWQKRVAASGKATFTPVPMTFSAGIASLTPDSVRANLFDLSAGFSHNRWQARAEYMYEHYTGNAHPDSHGWALWADYHFPIKAGIFNTMSVQGRYDGLTNHASLASAPVNSPGQPLRLATTSPTRNRITAGVTMTAAISKSLAAEVHANYEHYMYHSDAIVAPGESSKALLELVLRF